MKLTSEKKCISIKELEKYSSTNSLIISNNLKNYLDFNIFSFNAFCEYLIKKSPRLFFPKILSTEESEVLLCSMIKDLFKNHPVMYNLTKSMACIKEFHKLFDVFYKLEISTQDLLLAIKNSGILNDDIVRLELIINAYNMYDEKLKEENLLDTATISSFTLNLLEKHSQLLNITKQNCENIFVDSNLKLSPIEIKLLEKITPNIKFIETIEKKQNIIANAISKKYLNKNLNLEDAKNKLNILKFNDIKEEAQYISNTIFDKIEREKLALNDIIIAINDINALKIINDTLTQSNIPTNYEFANDLFLRFAVKLNQYFNICNNLEMIENTDKSKASKEDLYEELNMYFENIISETLNNQFIKDKFLSLLQSPNNQNLIACVEENLNILNNIDKEKLSLEIEKIKKLSNLYKDKQFAEFIGLAIQGEDLDTNSKQKTAKLIKQIVSIKNLLNQQKDKNISFQTIQEMLLSLIKPKPNNNEDCIKFMPIKSAQMQYSKILFLPNLTENSIPYNKNSIQFISQESDEKISKELRKKHPEFKNIITSQADELKESAEYLTNLLCLGQDEIIISTHTYEDKKQIIPSIFFQYISSIIKITEIEHSQKNENTEEQTVLINDSNINKNELIINENDQIRLSPSSISTFQTCPRKYYFSNLLGLKSTSTFSASYGTIAHAILELFNQKYLNSYNKETVLKLTEILFNANIEPQNALSIGFSSRTIELVQATDLLSLEEMKSQFLDAIDELEKNNFFQRIPDEIISEKTFQFQHPSIKNTIFEGRIDAIYKYKDNYVIIDFKTGADKPKLSYLISENGVNFKTPTGKDTNIETKQNEYEYQIPIYYLATQYSEDFKELKNKINSIGLLYIRPKNKHDGYKEDIINCEMIREFEDKLIQNLEETIINKIKNKEYFEPKTNSIICSNCTFNSLCEFNSEASDD